MNRSINQMAQDEGDSSANEANRIRLRERSVRTAWRTFVFNNDKNPTIKDVSDLASELSGEHLGYDYCLRILECDGLPTAA